MGGSKAGLLYSPCSKAWHLYFVLKDFTYALLVKRLALLPSVNPVIIFNIFSIIIYFSCEIQGTKVGGGQKGRGPKEEGTFWGGDLKRRGLFERGPKEGKPNEGGPKVGGPKKWGPNECLPDKQMFFPILYEKHLVWNECINCLFLTWMPVASGIPFGTMPAVLLFKKLITSFLTSSRDIFSTHSAAAPGTQKLSTFSLCHKMKRT